MTLPLHKFLKDLQVGDSFIGFYVLRKKELRSRRDGAPYLHLEFGDRSGRLRANLWDDAERLYHELEEEGIIKLQGMVETYQGQPQIAVKRLRRAQPDDEFNADDFLPISSLDARTALSLTRAYIRRVKNPYLNRLLEDFFSDEGFVNSFLRAPGGKLWHHNRIGGLAEHTLAVAKLCRIHSRLYPYIDEDLLITGALLHDIGKIEEYRCDTLIEYSDRGRFVGHIVIGAQWVQERLGRLEGFPPELADRLQHLILSHQAEFGSPVQPATREAFLLHYADQVDAKLDALKRIREGAADDSKWIWEPLLDRHLNLEVKD